MLQSHLNTTVNRTHLERQVPKVKWTEVTCKAQTPGTNFKFSLSADLEAFQTEGG